MGLKKTSRRLLKLARQAAHEMGEGGRDFVDTVFRTATQVLEEAIRRGTSKAPQAARKRSKAGAASRPGRGKMAPRRPANARSVDPKKAPASSRRGSPQHSRARRPTRPPAKPAPVRPRQRKSVSAPAQRSTQRPRVSRPPRPAAVIQEIPETAAPVVVEATVTGQENGSRG